jgi:hypothetical protein
MDGTRHPSRHWSRIFSTDMITDGPGMVAYYQTMGTRVAAGAPVAPPERVRACALAFARAANEAGNSACLLGIFQ